MRFWPWEKAKPKKAKKKRKPAPAPAKPSAGERMTQNIVNGLLADLTVADSLEAAANAVAQAAKALRKGKAA